MILTPATCLKAPQYRYKDGEKLGLAVYTMKDHMTDEGWQIFKGLEHAGYTLTGAHLPVNLVDVNEMLKRSPAVAVVQDKREWDLHRGDFRDPAAKFHNVETFKKHSDIFKVTILKDAHQRNGYHMQSAEEMGVHAWIIYYNPKYVVNLAPYVRPQHLIRTYHSLNADIVPEFKSKNNNHGALLSGALSKAYPLRQRLAKIYKNLHKVHYHRHPGYHRKGCNTPDYLHLLSKFKVCICTCSIYKYALRRMFEATACGCRVLTDLPEEERLPGIDGNLHRIGDGNNVPELNSILDYLYDTYDEETQREYAERAKKFYDYRAVGLRLAADIQAMRETYD